MTANIFGSRFTSRKLAAWHPFGGTHEEDLTAREALARMGQYHVELWPVMAVNPSGENVTMFDETLTTDTRAIVRFPTEDDSEFRTFGLVSKGYRLIGPWEMASIFDVAVDQPVETIGALGKGERFFITTKLPTIDVNGDEVELYLAVLSPMDGHGAAAGLTTPIRVVCANTYSMAERTTLDSFRVVHDATAPERLHDWLHDTYLNAKANVEVVQEALALLAGKTVEYGDGVSIIESTYPYPNKPKRDCPPDVFEQRMERFEKDRVSIRLRRDASFDGWWNQTLTGMTHMSCARTAYGLFNAVCEVEDFRRGGTLESTTESLLFGDRARTKRRAFEMLTEVSS